ncbi:MAG TPA: cation diffusion facilitator family transporter [Candidatus Bathyarchaeia archaeon]|nr:cation diffusion facilitator family transporter [Candidatus Bathyarchaeia archaeon]
MSEISVEPFSAGESIAKLSVLTLLVIGIVEISVGYLTQSVGLAADGVTSLLDALVSLIVWLGLHFSRRRPDERFHFGYHKVETFSALIVSLSMIVIATYIIFVSYLTFLNPRVIVYPALALVTLSAAGIASMYRALQMRAVAKKYGLLSLRTDANNSIKDATASCVVFASVLGASIGIRELDAVGGMIIGVYILGVAYVTVKEASLILVDACESSEITSVLKGALRTIPGVRDIASIKLRPSGPYLTGVVTVVVDGSETVLQTEDLSRRILEVMSTVIDTLGEVSVVFRSSQ